jgi:hypothetical protein
MQKSESPLTFEQFIEDSSTYMHQTKRKQISGVIVFSEKAAWAEFENVIRRFNSFSKKRWEANLIHTTQSDFFILRFKDIKQEKDDRFFFLKIIKDERYVNLLVFSYEGYGAFSTFKALIKNSRRMWLSWLGTSFLERFDEFIKEAYPDYSTRSVKFNIESRDVEYKKVKGTTENWISRSRDELLKLRNFYYTEFKEILYVRKGIYEISNGKVQFKLSLSDQSEFTLEKGELTEFLILLKEILLKAQEARELFTKNIFITKGKRDVKSLDKPIETVSIERVELLRVEFDQGSLDKVYSNLYKTFSLGYISEYKMASFIRESGNPYFLAEVVDLEYESRMFVSAIKNAIMISPANESTKPSSVSKLFALLQSRVDPTIRLAYNDTETLSA